MKDLRDPSERERERTGGGGGLIGKRYGEGEYERQHREDKKIKRERERERWYNGDNRAGSGRESLASFDQIVNVFSKKHMRSQPSRVLQHL